MSTRNPRLIWMVQIAILTAIVVLMAFTPLGFLKIGPVEITFIVLPVSIGAMLCGPAGGAFLGAVFGLCSFFQCFGLSAFGSTLLGINPFFTFVLCLVPRVLCGWLAGLVFQFLGRFDKTQLWSLPVCGFLTAALNTVFFVSTMMLLFGSSDYIMGMQAGAPLLTFLASFVGVNGLVEIAVCTVISAALVKPVLALRKKGKI